jgi:sugar phosphate isomerase/epimerase
MKTAVQLYSVRDNMAADFAGTLKEVGKMGYEGVEFAGLYGHSAENVKALCAEAGVTPISAHVSLAEMMSDLDGAMDTYAAIGCKFVVIPHMSTDYLPGHKDWDALQEIVNRAGKAARERGMALCYHNHNFEFERVNGEWAMDLMYKAFSPDVLQTEIDTCWVKFAGEDPAAYLRKYNGRTPVVHLKDFVGVKGEGTPYELINREGGGTASNFEFRPVGHGCQDVKSVVEAGIESGATWFVVEQDQWYDRCPLEAARMSIETLKNIGLKG